MSPRQSISTGSPYEPLIGISRAVRIGNNLAVAGTAPIGPDGQTTGLGDPAAQARRCFEIARVHGEFFQDIRPVNTVMQVSRFIDPDWLVEIEVDAVLSEAASPDQE